MMFHGTYPTEIYRELHLSLHDLLDLRRREAGLSRDPPHRCCPTCRSPSTMRGSSSGGSPCVRAKSRARNPNPTRLRIPVLSE